MDNPRITRCIEDLRELVDKIRNTPLDDRLTYAEIIGCFEAVKYEVIKEMQGEQL